MVILETDLAQSQIDHAEFIAYKTNNRIAIRLAEESEHQQDQIKNNDTLRIENSSFKYTGIETDGYDTQAALKISSSIFESSMIRGYYPRTEPIIIKNSKIIGSELDLTPIIKDYKI